MGTPIEQIDSERIAQRARIWYDVDSRTCKGCGAEFPAAAIEDSAWYVDEYLAPNESCPDQPVLVAEIRCPDCW